jgi:hypothetical protein
VDRLLPTVTSANERTCLITSEQLQPPDWTSLGECLRYLRKLHTIWYTKAKRGTVVQATPRLLLQVRSNRTPAALWYEQEERHTTYLTALSSIHIISPPLSGSQSLSLAMRSPSLTPLSEKQSNVIGKNDAVCEKCVQQRLRVSVRLTWQNSKLQEPKIDFQPGR